MDIQDIIIKLSELSGPSGQEESVTVAAAEMLKPYCDSVYTDVMGNLIAERKCGKADAPLLLLDAHLDEIGFFVTGHEEGFLKITNIGGVDTRMLPSCELKLMTEPPIYGVVCTMPPHVLSKADSEKNIKVSDLYLDCGLSDEEAENLVPVGTTAVYNYRTHVLGSTMICGKALDDRACFAALIKTAELLKEEPLSVDLTILGSVQEEVGLRGAETAAYGIHPTYAVCVDVCHASTPDYHGPDGREPGKGPALSIGPNMNRSFTKRLREAAASKGIKCQTCVDPDGDSGTNTAAVQVARGGICTALVNLPLKYMHTPVETIALSDVEDIAVMLCQFVKSL